MIPFDIRRQLAMVLTIQLAVAASDVHPDLQTLVVDVETSDSRVWSAERLPLDRVDESSLLRCTKGGRGSSIKNSE